MSIRFIAGDIFKSSVAINEIDKAELPTITAALIH
jgi:hypothetical protein